MPPILEKFHKYFPTILFLSSDDVHSMHFILSLKCMPDDQQKDLVELMLHCGAEISFSVEDATDYSAIIVDHNEIVTFKAPAFTVHYLEQCLKNLKVQNISDYRQDITSHIAKDTECMDVAYYRKQGWSSVLTEAEKQWFEEIVNSNRTEESSEPQAASTCVEFLDSRPGSSGRQDKTHPEEINPKNNNGFILSSDEDSDIDEIDKVGANKTQKEAENIPKISLSEKNKSENPAAVKENKRLLSKAHGTNLKVGTTVYSGKSKIGSCRSREVASSSSTSNAGSKKWEFLDDFQPESSDEEELQPQDVEKEKDKDFFDFKAGNEDLFKPNKDRKHSRMPYSYDEQCKILKYVVGHCEFSRVKGRELWMIMERRKICPNRTWQSMKEHFMKKIVFNLETFEFLTADDRKKIKSVAF